VMGWGRKNRVDILCLWNPFCHYRINSGLQPTIFWARWIQAYASSFLRLGLHPLTFLGNCCLFISPTCVSIITNFFALMCGKYLFSTSWSRAEENAVEIHYFSNDCYYCSYMLFFTFHAYSFCCIKSTAIFVVSEAPKCMMWVVLALWVDRQMFFLLW
jgi:hypothetical protein